MSSGLNGVSGSNAFTNTRLDDTGSIAKGIAKIASDVSQLVQTLAGDKTSTGPSGTANISDERQSALQQLATKKSDAAGYSPDPLDKLKTDPEYQKVIAELSQLEQEFEFQGVKYSLSDLIKVIDGDNRSANDGIIWKCDLEHTGHWQKGSGNLKEFAAKILQDPGINGMLVKLTGDFQNGAISLSTLESRIATLKTTKDQKETAAREASQSTSGNSLGGDKEIDTSQNPGGGKVGTDSGLPEIKIDMGEVTGGDPLSRSTERLGNALGSIETQIDDLIVMMGKEQDPAKLKQLEAHLNKLERLQSMFSKMQERLQTMIQNMSQMYHKIQMAAIQNIGR